MALTPEQEARENIDRMLAGAGWTVQSMSGLNLGAAKGVAVREFPLKTGFADYLLFADRKAVGVIEAKAEGKTLSQVAEQSGKYVVGLPKDIPHVELPLPFAYESTGVETLFRDNRDPDPRSRPVFSFHRPETLLALAAEQDTLRKRLMGMPPLIEEGLWLPQVEAVTNLEKSLAADRPRSLIQMATGSGKTFTACTFSYRLVKFAKARRILFLVDRNSLGRQTLREFQQYVTPDDGRKFTELYNVQHLTSNAFDPVSRVCISTIQRLFSMLTNGDDYDPSLDEHSVFEIDGDDEQPKQVGYNPKLTPETFDIIVTDECHRSIYNLWRQVLEYFDAHLIGLTATPSKQTLGFFENNLVMEYPHERAVADGINVGYEVYRIRTEITEQGGKVEAGYYVDKRDKATRKVRWEKQEEGLDYGGNELDRSVVAPDQIRTVVRTFRDKLFTEIFPGRTEVPKTLIFAKDDSHAEDIVQIVRKEFGKGNDFCKKITYRADEKTDDLIASLRNSYNPRIAVTVDLISTGVDVKPLECLLFMRDVRSRAYFDQMKGRGTRIIKPTDLQAVTPDTETKTHFVIVDAVGVCESDKTETRPLERQKTVPFEKLLRQVALGKRDDDTLSSLAARLARLDRQLEDRERERVVKASAGRALSVIINGLLDTIDPDKQIEAAKTKFGVADPTREQTAEARDDLARDACQPFDSPEFRDLLVELKTRSEQTIDTVTLDQLISAGYDEEAKEKAKGVIESFRQFIEDNRDELTALQIIYSRRYGDRHLTYDVIRELAEALTRPPHALNPDLVWHAYEQLEASKVKGRGSQRLLTDIISLVRFAMGEVVVLEPYADAVDDRFERWLQRQQAAGREFGDEQLGWLREIRNHIATSLEIEIEDFDYAPFGQRGGRLKAFELFGDDLDVIMGELNEVLAA